MDQLPDTRPENPETSSALATFTGEEECNSSAAGLQDQAAVGRLDYVDSTVEELENGPCGRVGQPRVPRKTFKSCEFCAKRKRRCDGDGVNRCRWVFIAQRTGGGVLLGRVEVDGKLSIHKGHSSRDE